ncbi:MAG: transcriptional repressor, partial [Helicobacteraceae bacterium]|nr:transcriptional repressor [Helicobacteraceae bacterium]
SVSFGASGKKYEFGLKEHHDHMICDSCGAMIEFVDKEIEKRQKEIASSKGFKIVSHAMQIRGLCKACQKTPFSARIDRRPKSFYRRSYF